MRGLHSECVTYRVFSNHSPIGRRGTAAAEIDSYPNASINTVQSIGIFVTIATSLKRIEIQNPYIICPGIEHRSYAFGVRLVFRDIIY